jgi:cell division protein FtsL
MTEKSSGKEMNASDATHSQQRDMTDPWASDIQRLEEKIESREPKGERATLTLIEVVLGSIVGVLLLAFQTYILWNQTELLATQSRAAQIEQVSKLRERIASNTNLQSQLQQLSQIHSTSFLIGCDNEASCALNPIVTLRTISKETRGEEIEGWLKLLPYLHYTLGRMERAVARPEIDVASAQAKRAFALAYVIRPAIILCEFDPHDAERLINRETRIASFFAHSKWADQWVNSPPSELFEAIRAETQAMLDDGLGIEGFLS